MQLAIHQRERSFSDRWIAYCDEQRIPYVVVNCLKSDIIQKINFSDALLWHWNHNDPHELFIARHVLMAAEAMGMTTFPNIPTCWHFDDKIAQKYLLEAVGAPLVPTSVFYSLTEALEWITQTSFPKVFKLRRGAGSTNVRLVKTRDEARALARQAFSHGFKSVPSYLNDAAKRYRITQERGDLLRALSRAPKTVWRIQKNNKLMGREKGYLYFQDFLPDNQFDTRVTIIGERGFAFIREVRPGDFRASGSGLIQYDPKQISLRCVETAFEVAKKLGSQSMAFDFIVAPDGRVMIAEISYCYDATAVHNCPGYWDHKLNWHPGHTWPENAILIDLLNVIATHRPSCASIEEKKSALAAT